MKRIILVLCFALAGGICPAQQLPAWLPVRGLVAWYPFSGNADDLSGHGRNGVIIGKVAPAADRFGKANSAYSFSGAPDSKIKIIMKTPLVLNSRTFSCWIKFPKTARTWYPTIFSTLQDGDYAHILGNHPAYENAKKVGTLFWSWVPGKKGIYSKQFFNDNKWHHVAMVACQDTHSYQLYSDGVLDTTMISANTTLEIDSIAFAYQSANDPPTSCVGSLDDIAIYDRALTANEVLKLFHAGTPNKRYPAALKKNVSKSDFTVVSDQAQQQLTVTMTPGAYQSYTVSDKTGTILIKQFITGAETKIDISMLKSGNYRLTLANGAHKKAVFFVIGRE